MARVLIPTQMAAEYVGNWANDKRHGQGIFEMKTALMNIVQDGLWENDVFQGENKMETPLETSWVKFYALEVPMKCHKCRMCQKIGMRVWVKSVGNIPVVAHM